MRKFHFIAAAATVALYFAPADSKAQIADTTRKTTPAASTPAPTATYDLATVLAGSSDYLTAAAAVKTAGLETALKTGGPYTIFAPNDAAFSKLPAGKLDSLMKDPTKMGAFLKGHVATGKYGKADIIKALTDGNGKATLTALDGQPLVLSVSPEQTLQITSASGSKAEVSLYDLLATNGVVNGLNGVLTPN